jgi:hypothetical protein
MKTIKFLLFISVFSIFGNLAFSASIIEKRLTENELITLKFEYQEIFDNQAIKEIPEMQLAQLLYFYKTHLNTGIDSKKYELIPDPKNKNKKILHPISFRFEISKKSEYVTFVNFSLDSNFHRMYVLDLRNKNLYGSFIVAHGNKTSNPGNDKQARYFSNENNSNKSSLGLYITDTIEHNNEKHGFAVRLHGLDTSNNLSFLRYIEIHGAEYVHQDTGAVEPGSLGCFVIDEKISREVISQLIGGTLLYAWIDPKLLPQQLSSAAQQISPQSPNGGSGFDDENRSAGN